MTNLLNYPLLIFAISSFVLWLAAWTGSRLGQRRRDLSEDLRSDYDVILAATLTLLGLIIGFSYSMATARYDLRKSYEEAEANAIGTEYVRADVLPEANAADVRSLLRQYTELRIRFYSTRRRDELEQINQETAEIQSKLWAAVAVPAKAQPSPLMMLTMAGMNDVLNSQGYTQAAWWNRIPTAAWFMMFLIAIFCNVLLGYGAHEVAPRLFLILPIVVAVSFFLIADIDSPRGGVIRVYPQNLKSLQRSLK